MRTFAVVLEYDILLPTIIISNRSLLELVFLIRGIRFLGLVDNFNSYTVIYSYEFLD